MAIFKFTYLDVVLSDIGIFIPKICTFLNIFKLSIEDFGIKHMKI